MFDSITIDNYKGFAHAEIPGISQITLLGGRNNVGKSTILEAMFTLFDRLDPELPIRHLTWRGMQLLPMDTDFLWSPMFNGYDQEKKISISLNENGKKHNITIRVNSDYRPRNLTIPAIAPNESKGMSSENILQTTKALEIKATVGNQTVQTSHLILTRSGRSMTIDHAVPPDRPALFLGSTTRGGTNDDASRLGQLDIQRRTDEVVDILKTLDSRIEGLSVIPTANGSTIYVDCQGIPKKIPITLMGDGVVRLLSISLAILTSRNGLVLLDEVENGFHYSVLAQLWSVVFKASQKAHCQVIASTHSYECLKAAADALKDSGKFSYHRLSRTIDGIGSSATFSGTELADAIDSDMEVR